MPADATPARTRPRRTLGHAMVLAAGRGTRLGAITTHLPKPLVEVGDGTLIDRVLDRLVESGVHSVTVNLFHHAALLERHLTARTAPRVTFSHEPELLDTGGGVKQALPNLGDGPFYVVNGDVAWEDGATPALRRLADAWDDGAMDALLLLHPAVRTVHYDGLGDFWCDPLGRLRRRKEREIVPFVFTGMQVLHPRLFDGAPEGRFSLNLLYDRAIEAGRLYGIVHDGDWIDAGTPERLDAARRGLRYDRQGRLL